MMELTDLEMKIQERTRELKEAKEAALRAQCAAEAANYTKSIFLMNVSHEFRTPLNCILGFTQLLRKDATLTEAQQGRLEKIEQSGWRLLTLINDILDMSSIDVRTIKLHESEFRFPELLTDIAETVRQKTEQKGLEFRYDLVSDIPPVVRGDKHRLRQILCSLLNNAIRFTEQGSVTLKISMERGEGADTVKFKIEDTGIGIPENQLNDIFEPFKQVAEGLRKIDGCAGLGLSISRELLRLMGSELYVNSSPGNGSVFWFALNLPEASGDDFKQR